ncbi:hypothetical protein ACIQZB_15115 [Streptomyces sp. NPDC097727]|uniref:hypothetical protein n=1 Tax=Streptomyces sp. NPDC097727 TaxID=3366092 RepID=UPI00381C96DF
MGDTNTRARLDAALAAEDIWSALFALTEEAPADLPASIEARYGRASKDERRHLSWLLGALGEPAVPVFLRLLGGSGGDDGAVELLDMVVQRRLRLPAAELHRLAEELGAVEPLVDAMGLSADAGFAPFLGGLLDHERLRGRAAVALGRLGAREWTVPIAQRLPGLTGLMHGAFVVALELLDDPAAIPHLLQELEANRPQAGDVHHALVALTGRHPLLPLTRSDGGDSTGLLHRVWSERRLDSPSPPSIPLALAWVEDVYVRAEYPERFLVAAVLDGHHKLAAYATAGVPARVLLLSRAEDNWGAETGWSEAFTEVLGQL